MQGLKSASSALEVATHPAEYGTAPAHPAHKEKGVCAFACTGTDSPSSCAPYLCQCTWPVLL
eukprot:1145668-Pelagomonas_calceolata.AAC.3